MKLWQSLMVCKVDDENVAEEEEQFDITFDPGVAYFIFYTPNEFCNEDIIHKLLHEDDMDCEVNKMSTWRPKDFDDENYMLQFKLSRELDAVVKDHDSPAISSLIRALNDFYCAKCMTEEIQRPDEHENLFGAHLPVPEAKFVSEKPSRLYLVNSKAFGQDLKVASKKLRCDGLRHDFITFHGKASTVTVGLDSGREVQRTMKGLNHALHRVMPPGAKYAYVYSMDVETYLHKMLVIGEHCETQISNWGFTLPSILWNNWAIKVWLWFDWSYVSTGNML